MSSKATAILLAAILVSAIAPAQEAWAGGPGTKRTDYRRAPSAEAPARAAPTPARATRTPSQRPKRFARTRRRIAAGAVVLAGLATAVGAYHGGHRFMSQHDSFRQATVATPAAREVIRKHLDTERFGFEADSEVTTSKSRFNVVLGDGTRVSMGRGEYLRLRGVSPDGNTIFGIVYGPNATPRSEQASTIHKRGVWEYAFVTATLEGGRWTSEQSMTFYGNQHPAQEFGSEVIVIRGD